MEQIIVSYISDIYENMNAKLFYNTLVFLPEFFSYPFTQPLHHKLRNVGIKDEELSSQIQFESAQYLKHSIVPRYEQNIHWQLLTLSAMGAFSAKRKKLTFPISI